MNISMQSTVLFSGILVSALLVVDNRLILLQLLHADKSPFFGVLTVSPVFKSTGIYSASHISNNNSCSRSIVEMLAFRISVRILSLPAVLSFLRLLMALIISFLVWGALFSLKDKVCVFETLILMHCLVLYLRKLFSLSAQLIFSTRSYIAVLPHWYSILLFDFLISCNMK